MHTFRVLDAKPDKDKSFLFQLQGNLFDKTAQNVVDARVMQSQILAGLQLLGFKLVASFDIGLYRASSDVETWVFQRTSPIGEFSLKGSQSKDGGRSPPSYDQGDNKSSSNHNIARNRAQ